MTRSAANPVISYDGNDVATNFSFPYKFYTETDLKVVHRASNLVETELVFNTDYTVNGGSLVLGATGSIDFPKVGSAFDTLASGTPDEQLTISLNLPYAEITDMSASYQFKDLNRSKDKNMGLAQQNNMRIIRSVRSPLTDPDTIDMELPPAALRASKFQFYDDTGASTVVSAAAQNTIPGTSIQVTKYADDVVVGDGAAIISIPSSLNGMNLVRAQAVVATAGTTGATTIQIFRIRTGGNADMLSSNISIASGDRIGAVGTINTASDDVATNDMLRVDVDAVSTTAPKGLVVILEFQLPSS